MTNSLPQFRVVLGARSGAPSTLGCITQLAAVAIGSGIIALPYAVSLIGDLWGIVTIYLVSCVCALTMRWMVSCSMMSNKTTFESNAKFFLGQHGHYFLTLNLIILLFGGSAAMMLVSVETIEAITGFNIWFSCLVSLVIVIGLTLYTGDDSLRLNFISYMTIGCTAIFVIVLIIQALEGPGEEGLSWSISSPTESISIVVNSYLMNFYVYTLMSRLGRPSLPSIHSITTRAVFFVITPVYLLIGLVGNYAFSGPPPNILLAVWTISPWLVESARISIALVNIFKLPLLVIPLRGSVFSPESRISVNTQSCLILCAVFALSRCFSSIASLLSLIGSTCGVAIGFLIPAFMFLSKLRIDSEQAELARRMVVNYQSHLDTDPITQTSSRERLAKYLLTMLVITISVGFIMCGIITDFLSNV